MVERHHARSSRLTPGDVIVLMLGITVVSIALKVAMTVSIAFVAWGSVTTFWVPLGALIAALSMLIRWKRPRPTPINVAVALIIAMNLLYWGTEHDNRLTTSNLIIHSCTTIAMYLTGLLPVLLVVSLRQRSRRRRIEST